MGRAVEKFVKLNQIICEESITLRRVRILLDLKEFLLGRRLQHNSSKG